MHIYTHIKYKRNDTLEMYKRGLQRPWWYLQRDGGGGCGSNVRLTVIFKRICESLCGQRSELGSALLEMVGGFCGTDGLGEKPESAAGPTMAEADGEQRLSSLLPRDSSHINAAAPSRLGNRRSGLSPEGNKIK